MRKILLVLVALGLVLGLTACQPNVTTVEHDPLRVTFTAKCDGLDVKVENIAPTRYPRGIIVMITFGDALYDPDDYATDTVLVRTTHTWSFQEANPPFPNGAKPPLVTVRTGTIGLIEQALTYPADCPT